MDNLAKIIGGRIRSARLKAGLSQESLAELAGLHPTYIGQLERGEKNATLESVHRTCRALGLPLEKLFERIDPLPEEGRNIPLECYDLLLSKPEQVQEQLLDILNGIDRIRRI